jgi:hypothetical protein
MDLESKPQQLDFSATWSKPNNKSPLLAVAPVPPIYLFKKARDISR